MNLSSVEKQILLGKIESLLNSIADPQIQQLARLMWELANLAEIKEKGEFGFGQGNSHVEESVPADTVGAGGAK